MNQRIKKLWLVQGFLAVVMISLLCKPVEAATLFFQPSDAVTKVGELFEVDIIISGLENDDLSAFDFYVNFDDTILDFNSYTLGDGLGDIDAGDSEDWSLGDLENGLINLSSFSWLWDFSFQADSFSLATLNFTAASLGISGLSFSDIMLSDDWGDDLEASFYNSSVEVMNPVPEPATFMLLGIGLFLMGKNGKRKINLA
ncbi:PEP-CTERM protein-sorting domain-containing protein [Desulfonema limicola]|uniref:PEP-CTERM protein-sorting domain-containing protein n=1 Tax=Desulfonema limicola TaxID=45656 RepID=A0A975BEG3_9BACT|nr:cohesin domain-containing protein [Desulfonema limicola]QTA83813.1 PEP-CTERM protein-sorting domain-containing protein [Desulfonema limicola]